MAKVMAAQLTRVHGYCCSCGLLYEASVLLSPLRFASPSNTVEAAHVHLTMCCWQCRKLVNLVAADKKPVKQRAKRRV